MDTGSARYQFGGVADVHAEALGKPGQRRFRLRLQVNAASAMLWMEKEQLHQVALLVQELLEAASPLSDPPASPLPSAHLPAGTETVEFQVGRVALGHDEVRDAVLFLVHEIEEEREDAPPTLSFWLARMQAQAMAIEAIEVCAAGRPKCALCGGPIDPTGHMCPKLNGHTTLEKLS